MTGERTPKRLQQSLAGMMRWADTPPEERSARMSELSRRAAAKREAERAAREAAGEVVKRKRRTRSDDPLPPLETLEVDMRAIQHERDRDGLPPLSFEALVREAALRQRRAVAEATYAAMKAAKDKP